jgi:hypothetical protein
VMKMPSDNLIYGILILFACVSAIIGGVSIHEGMILGSIFCLLLTGILIAVVIFCKSKKGNKNENK